MLEQVLKRVKTHQPQTVDAKARSQAAVLMAMTRTESPEIILTQRANGLSTHSGEVAFPGGHQDATDPDLMYTALREAEEEIGLAPGLVEVVGPMSQLVSLHGVKVTPFVGIVPDFLEYKANEAEIASVFNVPLEFFVNDPRAVTHRIDYLGESWFVPSYHFNGYKIWGLTAVMIVELVNVVYGMNIDLRVPPSNFQR